MHFGSKDYKEIGTKVCQAILVYTKIECPTLTSYLKSNNEEDSKSKTEVNPKPQINQNTESSVLPHSGVPKPSHIHSKSSGSNLPPLSTSKPADAKPTNMDISNKPYYSNIKNTTTATTNIPKHNSPFDKITHFHIYNDPQYKQNVNKHHSFNSLKQNNGNSDSNSIRRNLNSQFTYKSDGNATGGGGDGMCKNGQGGMDMDGVIGKNGDKCSKTSRDSLLNYINTDLILDEFIHFKPENDVLTESSEDGDCTSSDSDENLSQKELAKYLPRVSKKKSLKRKTNKYSSNRSQRQGSKGNNRGSNKNVRMSKLVRNLLFYHIISYRNPWLKVARRLYRAKWIMRYIGVHIIYKLRVLGLAKLITKVSSEL